MSTVTVIIHKLKQEWKTFALAVSTTVAGAWELASQWGANLPDLFSWVPDQFKSGVLFAVGLAFLLLRRYTPTVVEAPPAPEVPEVPAVPAVDPPKED